MIQRVKSSRTVVRRVIGTAVLAMLLGLLLAVVPASARQVYDYVYSGTFIDGSGSEGGPFNANIAGVAYDESSDRIIVATGANPGYISRFTKTGEPSSFNGVGSPDTVFVGPSAGFEFNTGSRPEVSIDNSGGPADGSIYLAGTDNGLRIFSYTRNGVARPGWAFRREGLCGIGVGPDGELWEGGRAGAADPDGGFIEGGLNVFNPDGEQIADYPANLPNENVCHPAVDDDGNVYVTNGNFKNGPVIKLRPAEPFPIFLYQLTLSTFNAQIAIDHSNDDVFVLEGNNVGVYDKTGARLEKFGPEDPAHSFAGLAGGPVGIAVDSQNHDVWIANRREYTGGVRHVEKFERSAPITVPATTVRTPDYAGSSATLKGTVNPDGIETADCHFEWGTTASLGSTTPCVEGNSFSGTADVAVTGQLAGLIKGKTYIYRLSAKNGNERESISGPETFIAQDKPIVEAAFADKVNTDGVRFNADVDPNGGNTQVHFEYGTSTAYGKTTPASGPFGLLAIEHVTQTVTGLSAGTTYHYRIVSENEAGVTAGEDQTFKTYFPAPATDPCPNAGVRQQVGASLLMDCRAYELVSAPNAGGYDVVSDLTPGRRPYPAHPRASDRMLYSLSYGVIPGIDGYPTNFGRDPYVASRGETAGWSTRYVGVPATGIPDTDSYGSPVLAADPGLTEFAFGGTDICSPCFDDVFGKATNIPLRLREGSLVKGMAGSLNPPANPTGYVAKYFSDDGGHFVFGADEPFETLGNDGQVSIYDRDLGSGETQVVSTMPDGTTMTGDVGGLDISGDGSKIVVGERMSTDTAGNAYWHPYMHIGTNVATFDLAPGTSSGVLYAGMTSDGSKVFFTTTDALVGSDEDASSDLYQAGVSPTGTVNLKLLSTGGPGSVGNVDTCDPANNADGNNWNAVGGASADTCGVVGIAGGGGVAPDDGTIYFFSPERLDGKGTDGQPNLFIVEADGVPRFVQTLEPDNPALRNAVKDSEVYRFGDFQVTPSGNFAAFNSALSLTGYPTNGVTEIYRYDAGTKTIQCASCAPTGVLAASGSSLPDYGLALTDDGRVFFSTRESFALRDTNEQLDAYEWANGATELISRGTGGDDSGVLSASADGTNVFFFTRDRLVHEDTNGNTVKIYTARERGGFVNDPAPFPCAASDECHGPGTQEPAPPNINTFTGAGTSLSLARSSSRCADLVRRAARSRRRAHELVRKAKKALGERRAQVLRRRAGQTTRKARTLTRQARACRRSKRGKG